MRNCSHIVSAACIVLLCSISAFAAKKQEEKKAVETKVETKAIPATVEYQFSRLVGPGRIQKIQDGKPGEVRRTYEIIRKDDKPVDKKLIKEERVEPKPTLFAMGKAGFPTSRGAFGRGRVMTMQASAYDPSPASNGGSGRTKMGYRVAYGHVAVDPRVIPLGTMVFVEGYGFAIASDIGSAIKGNRIDLCYRNRSEAMEFGRRNVRVHILRKLG